MARKKRRSGPIIFTTLVMLSLIAVAFYYARQDLLSTSVHYREFGIAIPKRYHIHGIDVSRYQHKIQWEDVRAMEVEGIRLGFAFIKATEGRRIKDHHFNRNWRAARASGMVRGAYHYFHPAVDPAAQAAHFIQQVKLKKGDLPPVLDVEETNGVSKGELIAAMKIWLDAAEQAYGVKPIIYTGPHFYETWLEGHFDDYPLWIAHYDTHRPRIGRQWHFWQHSESGSVDGIRGKVDFNVFNGDSAAFKRLLIR